MFKLALWDYGAIKLRLGSINKCIIASYYLKPIKASLLFEANIEHQRADTDSILYDCTSINQQRSQKVFKIKDG